MCSEAWPVYGYGTDPNVCSDDAFRSLGEAVRKLEMKKESIGWGLEELEEATAAVEEDGL